MPKTVVVLLVLLALAVAVIPAHAATWYVVQCRPLGSGAAWENAPEEFIYDPLMQFPPPYPGLPVRLYEVRRDANAAREVGKVNHPDYEWRVDTLVW